MAKPPPSNATTTRPPRRKSVLFLSAAMGAMLGLGCVLAYWVFSFRDPLPELSPRDFAEARQRWRENGPAHYDIEVEVSGRQPATYRVEVRHGEPVAASRNGRPLTQRRVWGTWSAPGMFSTLASDFRNVERVRAGEADDTTPRLSLRGIFHPTFGYPQQYRRITHSQGSEASMPHRIGQSPGMLGASADSLEVSWRVTEFTVHNEPLPAP